MPAIDPRTWSDDKLLRLAAAAAELLDDADYCSTLPAGSREELDSRYSAMLAEMDRRRVARADWAHWEARNA